jgi:hypothetical protein
LPFSHRSFRPLLRKLLITAVLSVAYHATAGKLVPGLLG